MKHIPPHHLYSLRNDVDVAEVIEALQIPTQRQRRRVTFRCPDCGRFHTATNHDRNLAYCFPCGRSFNTIDLVLEERGCTFLEAVKLLESLLG